MDNKRKKTFLRYVFLLCLMLITIYLVLKSLDISKLSSVITMVKKEFLLVGGVVILFYIILDLFLKLLLKLILFSSNIFSFDFSFNFKLSFATVINNLILLV